MKKESKFGLPTEIKYCTKCNIINQKPTSTNEYLHDKFTKQIPIEFDENNVTAFQFHPEKSGKDGLLLLKTITRNIF